MSGDLVDPSKKRLIVYLRGGLGNQLFQIAAGLSASSHSKRRLLLSTALLPREEDTLGGVSRWPLMVEQLEGLKLNIEDSHFQPRGSTSLRSKFLTLTDMTSRVNSNFSRRMGIVRPETLHRITEVRVSAARLIALSMDATAVLDVLPRIRAAFQNLANPSPLFRSLLQRSLNERPNIMHIRAGDMERLTSTYGRVSRSYWETALSRLIVERPVWLFTDASDPMAKARDSGLDPDLIIPASERQLSAVENLSLMSTGSSFVGSNSTYSWWAAAIGSSTRVVYLPKVPEGMTSIESLGSLDREWHWIGA